MAKDKIHVLLIEDDPDDYVLTRALLNEMKGYEARLDWASSYEEGTRKSRQGDHDVILVDYRLGRHNGIDFLQSAQNQCSAPIIFLTGQENYEIDVAATQAGAADYLVKTDITPALMERSIRYAVQHKRVECAWRNALQENNRLAAAITNLPIGVIITDQAQEDQPIIFVNPAFTKITGYSMMDVMGRNCRFLQGEDTNPQVVAQIRDAIRLAQPFQGQILNYCKDGTPFWNDLRLQPLFGEGRVGNFVGLMHDISSHVEAAQDNRDLLVNLGERVKEMTALHAVARILQEEISSPEMLQRLVEQIPPAFQFPERIAARLALGSQEYSTPHFAPSNHSLSSHARLSDGREVGLEVNYRANQPAADTPFLEEERSLLQSVVEVLCSRWERDLARDELQKAHAQLEARVASRTLQLQLRTNELRDSEERLRKINRGILALSHLKFPPQATIREVLGTFTQAAVGSMNIERASAWLYDEAREFAHCIDAFEGKSGAHEQDGKLAIADFARTFAALKIDRTLAVNNTHDHFVENSFTAHLRDQGIAAILVAPIFKDGEIVGFLSLSCLEKPYNWTLEDQTYAGSLADLIALEMESLELQKAEESLRLATLEAEAARRSAEDANNAKSEFLSRMSHELRTPLNSILGFSQLLQRDELTDKQQERITLIVNAGRHLLSLINEVLDIARVESGHMALSIEPVQLASVLQEALSLLAPLAAKHNISLINETLDDPRWENFFALADRQKLHQVLLNLLSNAVKYNQENGHVRVSCEALEERRMRLSIINTGHGIAPEDLERAFIPFERLNADQSGIEGTGLGLALVKRLVGAMNGTVEARSTPGAETVFAVTLPVTSDPLQAPRASLDRVQQLLPQENFCVLYIEDNLTNLKLLENIFGELKNVQLITSMQGRLGLELAREHLPDLILLDLHLPDINGDEVLRSLKTTPLTQEIPVIIVSADATLARQQQLRDQGAHDYLTKPLDINLFLSTINAVVRQKKNARMRQNKSK